MKIGAWMQQLCPVSQPLPVMRNTDNWTLRYRDHYSFTNPRQDILHDDSTCREHKSRGWDEQSQSDVGHGNVPIWSSERRCLLLTSAQKLEVAILFLRNNRCITTNNLNSHRSATTRNTSTKSFHSEVLHVFVGLLYHGYLVNLFDVNCADVIMARPKMREKDIWRSRRVWKLTVDD